MNLPWLTESWRIFWPSPWLNIVLVVAAILCGTLIGGERQRREKPAGLRTLSLVCLGSAIFTMLSFAFASNTGDSGRVAAQIVTGIGFLGAGVILHGRRVVSGLTTAATIWTVAAIGMAVGAGYALPGLALSFFVNRVLTFFSYYETHWHPNLRNVCFTLEFEPLGGVTRIRLERILVDYNLVAVVTEWTQPQGDLGRLVLKTRLARVHLYELLNELVDVPHILSIQEQRPPASIPSTP